MKRGFSAGNVIYLQSCSLLHVTALRASHQRRRRLRLVGVVLALMAAAMVLL